MSARVRARRAAADLPRMAARQLAIPRNLLRYARPGASLTYSICSLSRPEGPAVAAALLEGGARRAPAPAGFPADVLTPEGELLTLPDRHGCDGFYAVRVSPRPQTP